MSAYTRMRDGIYAKLQQASQDFTSQAEIEIEPGLLVRSNVKTPRQFFNLIMSLSDMISGAVGQELTLSYKTSEEPPPPEAHPRSVTHISFTLGGPENFSHFPPDLKPTQIIDNRGIRGN